MNRSLIGADATVRHHDRMFGVAQTRQRDLAETEDHLLPLVDAVGVSSQPTPRYGEWRTLLGSR